MHLFVRFGRIEAYGEDVRLWSFFNGHVLVFRSVRRFRWLIEIV